MRIPTRGALALLAMAGFLSCAEPTTAPRTRAHPSGTPLLTLSATRPQLVISQVYGGGGNTGATYKNDFIELFNPGTAPVSVNGWSVQYTSAGGNTWAVTPLTNVSIPAGGYYLVQEAAGTGVATSLPTPDATGGIAMSATAGKVALSSTTTAFTGTCPATAAAIDEVSFGAATDCGFGVTPALTNTTAAIRQGSGCTYTGVLGADFATGAAAPRNAASAAHLCGVVQPPPAAVKVTPDSAGVLVGATQSYAAAAKASDSTAVTTTFTWSSSNTAVATVDASGVATGVAAGTAVVTATTPNGVSGTAKLTVTAAAPPPPAADVVISQVYGGGGNSGAPYTNDYIELFNHGATPADLTGWSVQYTSATGTSWSVTPLVGTIQPGRHYLIQEAAGAAVTASLPAPDAVGTIGLGATAGKVRLVRGTAALSGTCPTGTLVVDQVSYGTGASDCGSGTTAATSNTTAAFRKNDGCVNTGSTSGDFVVLAPNPRDGASPQKYCTQPARAQSTATVVIDELMGDPASAESASWGQWFEVHNYGTAPVDLKGWAIVSDGTSQPDHTIASDVIVPAGGYVILGRGGDVTRNGGVTLDYNYFTGNATTIWLDASDYLMLVDGAGARVDSVAWTSLPHGVTKALRNVAASHANVDDLTAWGYSTTTFGDGDYGTPDAANGTLADVAPFVTANRIAFSGRLTTDAPLPVGFEAQVFASETDANGLAIPTTFTWSSLTPGIASVDAGGIIHALAAGTATFRAVAADGTARNYSLQMETPVASTTAQYLNNTEFGVPTDADPSDDFLIQRPQYTISYNGSRGIPNWVAYDLNATHIVSGQDRCNCFTADPLVDAAGFTHLTTADYTGAGSFAGYGIDRGHMTRSFDRTSGTLDNARTFYLSNVVPQASDLNQGPWANMENYLGALAQSQNKEVYIYTGPAGSKGTVKNEGKITIPAYTWKVAVVMDRGKGVADVHDYRDVQVVAAVMPNVAGIKTVDWTTAYQVTADSVEKLTGYHFLTALPPGIQVVLKGRTHAPVAVAGGPYAGTEGAAIHFDGSASSDPDGDPIALAWDFGDGQSGAGATPTHTYADNGTYTVKLVATDTVGATSIVATTTVTVANAAPVVIAGAGARIRERESVTLAPSFSDAGTVDAPWSYAVNWGDGTGGQYVTTGTTSTQGAFQATHRYAVAGTYTVRVDVTDKDGLAGSDQLVVTVDPAGYTPAGTSVVVRPIDPTTDAQPATFTFADVGTAGLTTLVSGSQAPAGTAAIGGAFRPADAPLFYDIATTAAFQGTATVCVTYPADLFATGGQPALLHWDAGAWVDVTASVDIATHTLCGATTHFSPFAVARRDRRPAANIGGPYTGNESSLITFDGGRSTDPDQGDALTYQWTFGDGAAATGAQVGHVYARYGTYVVRLVVSDGTLADTTTTTAQVADVAPAIGAFAGATLLPGETYAASGAFTDPGADTWTATVDWGDGASGPLTLAGQAFTLSHTYGAAGTFTVTVRISDGALTDTRTQTVTVLSAAQAVQNADAMVARLVADGALSSGNGNALQSKLEAAADQLGKGDRPAAANQLASAINDLDALVRAGRLTAAQAAPLRTLLDRTIRSLTAAP